MKRIIGYLDQVTDDALTGWVADLDRPERLSSVVCRALDGSERTFQSFLLRLDVCSALGTNGRFGFAIPLPLLTGMEPGITLYDAAGSVLNNASWIELPRIPDVPAGPCRVLLHIQKTAGTSLRNALTSAMRPGEFLFIYSDGMTGISPEELQALSTEQRGALRFAMGHTYFGVADALPGRPDYITFLRDPEARLRSHYFHHRSHDASPVDDAGTRLDLHEAVERGLTDEYDNLMVRIVAGLRTTAVPPGQLDESHVDLALHNIRTRFLFVGLVERMQDHYPALCRALGIPEAPLPFDNVSRIQDPAAEASRIDWPAVMHNNRFDTMLYDRVQSEGLTGRAL